MTSTAFADLAGRLNEVQVLTAQDPVRAGATAPAALSAAVNRACLVLLTAHLEGFLEDIASEAIDALVAHGAQVEQLPLLLRALHAEEHLRPLEVMKDRNARAPRIEILFGTEGPLWITGTSVHPTMLRAKTVCGQMTNPGSNDVRQFLELLGVDIQAELDTSGQTALLGQIDGLVGRRNAIAHGEATVSATFGDVDSYLSSVEDLAREVDFAIARAVQSMCALAVAPW